MEEPNLIRIESILNPQDGKLPFAYSSKELDGRVTWHCGYDHEHRIIAVFCHDDPSTGKDKRVAVLKSMKEAIDMRDILISSGWEKLKPPEITVKQSDGTDKPINRKQKRYLSKEVNKKAKDNPFDEEES